MNQRVKKLLKRLRSGEWKAITGRFTRGKNRYCILGAITKEYELQTGKQMYDPQTHLYVNASEQESLSSDVAEYFRFKGIDPAVPYDEDDVTELVELNDDRELTLPEMADLIEQNEKQLFVQPRVTKKPKAKAKAKTVKPVKEKQSLNEYLGSSFIDAHIKAQERRQLQLQK